LAARRIHGAYLREEPPFRAGDVHRGQALAKHGRLRTRFASGDFDRQRDGRRCGRGGIRAAGHRRSMRAHVLEDQVAKFLGAIAGELAGSHEPAGERPGQARRMRDLDRDLFFGTGVAAHGKGQTSNHGIASYRRAAGADLLSIRSTDHAPDPAIMIAAVIASTSTWNSKPSPFCRPPQFMKKPFTACTLAIATTITQAMPNAATRPSRPTIRPIPPKNSAATTRNANTAGMPVCSKPLMVAEKPRPPHQPSIFCAPCAKNTAPSARRKMVGAA